MKYSVYLFLTIMLLGCSIDQNNTASEINLDEIIELSKPLKASLIPTDEVTQQISTRTFCGYTLQMNFKSYDKIFGGAKNLYLNTRDSDDYGNSMEIIDVDLATDPPLNTWLTVQYPTGIPNFCLGDNVAVHTINEQFQVSVELRFAGATNVTGLFDFSPTQVDFVQFLQLQ